MTQFRVLVLLVAVDFISKIVAFRLLSEGRPVDLDALFQFALQRNESGMSTGLQAALTRVHLSQVLATMIGYLVLAFVLIKIRGRRLGLLRRAAIGIVAAVVPMLLVRPAAIALVNAWPPTSVVALSRGTAIVLIGMIWWVAPTRLIQLGLTLLMAAGIGNLLSLGYPPFQIVDFMYSRLTARVLGLGVFNVADLYIPVSYACLAVGVLQYAARRVRNFRDSRRLVS